MKKILLTILTMATLGGCVTATQVPIINLTNKFNENQAKKQLEKGRNTIEGSALLRTRGGDVKTCAGLTVTLIPATDYATERMTYYYGNPDRGYSQYSYWGYAKKVKFIVDEPNYYKLVKTVYCDSLGKFKFTGIKSGDYYIVNNVEWDAVINTGMGYSTKTQGGSMMQRIHVSDNEENLVTLSSSMGPDEFFLYR